MFARAFNLLRAPAPEWGAIAAEGDTWLALAVRYVLPLAAIPAVAWMTGRALFPGDLTTWETGAAGVQTGQIMRAGVVAFGASVFWVAALAAAFCLIAPMYGIARDWTRAWKVAAYGSTPVWLVGVVLVKPLLVGVLVIALLHCSYLYYAGLQVVSGVQRGAAAEYVAVAVLFALVLSTFAGAMLAGIGPA